MFRFVAELGRKLRVARVKPGNIVRQDWSITVMPERNREGENLEKTGCVPRGGSSKTAHHTVASGSNIAFGLTDFTNRVRQFRRSEQKIGETATKFARRTIIIAGRILNISARVRDERNSKQREEQMFFHKRTLNNFSYPKSTFIFDVASLRVDLDNKSAHSGWRRRQRDR